MVVLSLFDGMSCGQIALRELGAKIDTYYASEVDKYAIQQTQYNFPDTVQLGDVRNVDARKLGHVDLLIGGSPCQSFSFAGKRAGMSTKEKEEIYTLDRYLELKQAGFEFEGQSYLFWEYVRILQELRERVTQTFCFCWKTWKWAKSGKAFYQTLSGYAACILTVLWYLRKYANAYTGLIYARHPTY